MVELDAKEYERLKVKAEGYDEIKRIVKHRQKCIGKALAYTNVSLTLSIQEIKLKEIN